MLKKYLLYTILLLPFCYLLAKPTWELVLKKDGFKVYHKKVEGSSFIAVKGTGVIREPIAKILAVVLDYKHLKEWQPNLETFERLVTYNDKHFINYFAMNLPWPVTDRDVVMKHIIKVDEQKKWVHVFMTRTTHKKRPVRSGFIRVPFTKGRWSLKSIKNGKETWLEFQNQGDPGGWIPAWLVNWISKHQIAGSITRLKKRVNKVKGNYNNAVVQEVMKWQ